MRNLKTRPIRSVLAARKMFANGGMVAPSVSGILASSQPLMQAAGQQGQFSQPMGQQGRSFVDSMTQDAVNPMGGGTLAMAEGGVARFRDGGTGIRSPRRGTPTQLGLGAAPEDVMDRYDATPSQRMEKMFPYEAGLKAGFAGGQLLQRPNTEPVSPFMEAETFPERYMDKLARLASQAGMHASNALWDFGETVFTKKDPRATYDVKFDQIEGVNDLLRRMPRVKGVHPEQISKEIAALATQITTDDPTISGKEMKLQISDFIYNKYEVPSEPYAAAKEFAEVEMPAFMEAEGDVGHRSVAERIADAQKPPDLVPKFMADEPHAFLQDAPELDEFVTERVDEDIGGIPDTYEDIVAEAPADTDVPDPRQKPTLEERGIFEIIDAESVGGLDDEDARKPLVPVERPLAAVDDSVSVSEGVARITQDPMTGDATLATAMYQQRLIKDAANAGDTKKTTEGLEAYIQEFKDAIPKYEGKSEFEQGMDIVKMGMAIAAGESPNAITNIAKGVMATIDNFTSDDKERRAYERQVALSAGKYALGRVNQDRTQAFNLAKEGRAVLKYVAAKPFTWEGKDYVKGEPFEITRDQWNSGILGKLPAGAVQDPQVFKVLDDNIQALEKLRIKGGKEGRVGAGTFTKDRETYMKRIKDLKNGAKMKGLLLNAAQIASSEGGKGVLGFNATFQGWMDSALNAVGMQRGDKDIPSTFKGLRELASTDRKKYNAYMKIIGTTMVTQILNESNKTISEGDRARVDELVTAYTDFDGTTQSLEVLKIRLRNLERSINDGIIAADNEMKGIESQWSKEITKGGQSLGETVKGIRTRAFPPARLAGLARVSDKPVFYKDIINIETRKFTPKYQQIFGPRKTS